MARRIVLAPDSFKESISAADACVAIERGMRRVWPDAEFVHVPMADGGEGTVAALVAATGGSLRSTRVEGPLGEPVDATWGMLGDGTTAVVEMAEASGLALVPTGARNPRLTSTFGVGQLLVAALDAGAERIILGIGGSSTNDAGAGLAQALGVRLLDADGAELPRGGAALAGLASIDATGIELRLASVELLVACDVTNPLCGPDGASAVYGPQKGADEACVAELDAALAHWAEVVHRDLGRDVAEAPGAGAAGGLGAGLLALTPAVLRPGIDIVIDHSGLRESLVGADLVVTGEGRMDGQTLSGKTPMGVAQAAAAAGVPVVGLAGGLGVGHESLLDHGFLAVLPVVPGVVDLPTALREADANLARTALTVAALLEARLGGIVTGSV